ncbi:hypothetical protein L486_07424 [Kwoniella mangroviensis CBS 10435]|uniref:Uncharacterized protein n=1 Tax=Kwoniella mangroviensis CBS 10435 TaxID=1331196 RepID=A0A1B9IHZ1_9TREE|nr:hypothetical protein L486_07424 [Kwoniella mangroviensis CBS 10435]
MSSSTTFILSSSSSSTPLPSSPSLALLPFSLGPNSSPYTSDHAHLSNYFKPRPIPSSSHGSTSTSTIASFRGRTVVGQYIDIPKGWKGVILGTGKRPDKGGLLDIASSSESHSDSSNVVKTKVEDVNMVTEEEGMDMDLGLRRTTRQNPQRRRGPSTGTGQVALSKPKIRGSNNTVRQSKKRYRLDSDDDDDDENDNDKESTIKEERLIRTPSKRSKLSYTTPQKTQPQGQGDVVVPDIVIQEATPLKYPLPTPKKRLNGRRSSPSPDPHGNRGLPQVTESMEWVEEQIIPKVEEVKEDGDEQESQSQSQSQWQSQSIISNELKEDINTNEDLKIDEKEEEEEENLIPSPSTEDDPPTFNTDVKTDIRTETEKPNQKTIDKSNMDNSSNEKIDHNGGYQEGEYDGPMRILKPISTFDGYMLYTPDDPLIGFRSDELDHIQSQSQSQPQNGDEQITKSGNENETNGKNNPDVKIPDTDVKEKDSDGSIQVRKSWWRSGGGGEGGDEFIRGLGEWLGLVEVLNQPVYLDELEEDEDDEEN